MNIGVLGAGVIGVSTAYALARLGHQVTVIDKNDSVAGEASHANGAQLSYSYVEPFANSGTFKALPSYLLGRDPAIQLGLSLSPRFLSWGIRFLGNCFPFRSQQNLEQRAALAKQSAAAFQDFAQDLPTFPAATGQGKFVLLSKQRDVQAARQAHPKFEALGLEHTLLSKDQCLDIEPSLSSITDPFSGAIFSKSDFALDPVMYCKALKNAATKIGVKFQLGETISKLKISNRRITGIITQSDELTFDTVIVCLGNDTSGILRSAGLSVPILPMQGYSLTFDATKTTPRASVTSLKHKIVYANLGKQVRIAGLTDSNLNPQKVSQRQDFLHSLSEQLWPDIADYDGPVTRWSQFRPMTPSGVPLIGETRIKNLYLNMGHGSLGYTFAAGSAMKLAAEIGHALKNYKTVPGGYKHAVS